MSLPSLSTLLHPFGAPEGAVVALDAPLAPALEIDYLDLIRRPDDSPNGVVRIGAETVAYVLRSAQGATDPKRIQDIRRRLAQRDDSPFLVVVSEGRLEVYGIALDRLSADRAWLDTIRADEKRAPSTFRRLHQEPSGLEALRTQAIHELLYHLLTRAIDGLVQSGLARQDAIALTGRALFLRFLVDRQVLGAHVRPSIICRDKDAKDWPDLFSSSARCQNSNGWLDVTFNGDFLPVSADAYPLLSPTACDLLRAVMLRGRQTSLDLAPAISGLEAPLEWDELDFAHIPVGVLSQVYEHQAERWDPEGRARDSVYYTPRRIAEYMVREAFAHLEAKQGTPPSDIRVLDPAVGGGVFLVAAFREIVAAYRRRYGRHPSSRHLRRILFDQLAGFDIQDAALSLTSLSLYLTAIELDRPPYRLADLRFPDRLRGKVLFSLGERLGGTDGAAPGSLGHAVAPEHRHRYDLVLGNPPWTSLGGSSGARVIADAKQLIRPLVEQRLGKERAAVFNIPDQLPDLPFVWRAMEWARPGGVLAFALHGRLLFKTTPKAIAARRDLFDAVKIWGVLNGADIRLTPVWPHVSDHFCFLFADNELAGSGHHFHVASPYFERALNEQGRLRIDPDAAQPISVERLKESPYLLKALFRGTALDVDLLDRVLRHPRLEDYWKKDLGLNLGDGLRKFRPGRPSKAQDAKHLRGQRLVTTAAAVDIVINPERLPIFEDEQADRARDPAIYQGPLMLLRESMKVAPELSGLISVERGHICDDGVLFTESFFGFSAAKHPDGKMLVRYLCLLAHSNLFDWFHLVTSGKFGVEREVLNLDDAKNFPIVPLAQLTSAQRKRVDSLFDKLSARQLSYADLDAWVIDVYRLGKRAAEVLSDTLRMSVPYTKNKEYAAGVPEDEMVQQFAKRLSERLSPFGRASVRALPANAEDPYRVLLIGDPSPTDAALAGMQNVLETADRFDSSECVVVEEQKRRIWLARLAQRRYWTLSRARLTAARLVERYAADLERLS